MTAEQLDYFTDQTKRAVEIGTRNGVRHYRDRAMAGFLILALGLLAVTWLGSHDSSQSREAIVTSGRAVSVAGCNRDYASLSALRGVLAASDTFALTAFKHKRITAADYQQRHDFYVKQLTTLPLPDCRVAERVITDDPRDPRSIPTPLHPPKGG